MAISMMYIKTVEYVYHWRRFSGRKVTTAQMTYRFAPCTVHGTRRPLYFNETRHHTRECAYLDSMLVIVQAFDFLRRQETLSKRWLGFTNALEITQQK